MQENNTLESYKDKKRRRIFNKKKRKQEKLIRHYNEIYKITQYRSDYRTGCLITKITRDFKFPTAYSDAKCRKIDYFNNDRIYLKTYAEFEREWLENGRLSIYSSKIEPKVSHINKNNADSNKFITAHNNFTSHENYPFQKAVQIILKNKNDRFKPQNPFAANFPSKTLKNNKEQNQSNQLFGLYRHITTKNPELCRKNWCQIIQPKYWNQTYLGRENLTSLHNHKTYFRKSRLPFISNVRSIRPVWHIQNKTKYVNYDGTKQNKRADKRKNKGGFYRMNYYNRLKGFFGIARRQEAEFLSRVGRKEWNLKLKSDGRCLKRKMIENDINCYNVTLFSNCSIKKLEYQ